MSKHSEAFEKLCNHAREAAMIESVQALLEWDERTKMPLAAGEYRAEQITYLSGVLHKKRTAPEIWQWLAELKDGALFEDPHSDSATTIRQLDRDYQKRVKLPQALVEDLTRASILGQQAWVKARKDNDFPGFAPFLE